VVWNRNYSFFHHLKFLKMKTLLLSLAFLLPLLVSAQFDGFYNPDNWTLSRSNPCDNGYVNASGAPASIEIWSSDNTGCGNSVVYYGITAFTSGTVSFDWVYTTFDRDGSFYDRFGYFKGNEVVQISPLGLPNGASESGTTTFEVNQGETFGFYMESVDNVLGRARSVISNFSAPACDLVLTVDVPSVIYYGYAPMSCTNITATASSSNGPVTINGIGQVCATSGDCIEVVVTAVDAAGCEASQTVTVPVIDVVCPNGNGNPRVKICHNGNSICVAPSAVPAMLNNGATLGDCGAVPDCEEVQGLQVSNDSGQTRTKAEQAALVRQVTDAISASWTNPSENPGNTRNSQVSNVYPNPASHVLSISPVHRGLEGQVQVTILNLLGQVIHSSEQQLNQGSTVEMDIRSLESGQYTILFEAANGYKTTEKLVVAKK
jgi:hypothetical protein